MKKLLLMLLVLLSARMGAQITSENLGSKDMDGTRKVTVVLPDGYDKREKYPLFVVLNASRLLEPTVTSFRYFSRTGEVPPSIIVGIYNDEDDVTVPEETGVPFNDTAVFFEFVGQTVIPRVQSKYSTNGFRGIIGDGEAANFINYYLLKENSLFNAYISLSPNMMEKITNSIPEQLASFKTPIFYYLGWTQDEDNATLKKITDLDKLMSVKKLEHSFYFSQPFPKITTSTVSIMGISEALNLFFEEYRPISMREYAEKVLKVQNNTTQYLQDKYKKVEKELQTLKEKAALQAGNDLAKSAVEINGVSVIVQQLDGIEAKSLRAMVDSLKNQLGSAVVVFASALDEKVNLIVGVTQDLTAKVKAGELVNLMAQQVGGKGGGRPDMAMAGGTEPQNINKALSVCSDLLKANL